MKQTPDKPEQMSFTFEAIMEDEPTTRPQRSRATNESAKILDFGMLVRLRRTSHQKDEEKQLLRSIRESIKHLG